MRTRRSCRDSNTKNPLSETSISTKKAFHRTSFFVIPRLCFRQRNALLASCPTQQGARAEKSNVVSK